MPAILITATRKRLAYAGHAPTTATPPLLPGFGWHWTPRCLASDGPGAAIGGDRPICFSDLPHVRQPMHRYLYIIANSNAVNGQAPTVRVSYSPVLD